TGREVVAFRMHVPSRIVFENATSNVQRGNILAWEQPLADRVAGVPLKLEVDMEPESILHSTLLLFASTVAAAGTSFGLGRFWSTGSPTRPKLRLLSSAGRSPGTRRTSAQSIAQAVARHRRSRPPRASRGCAPR